MVLCRRTSWADVKAVFNDSPDVPLLVDCEVLDDLDQLMHDQLWEHARAGEANNDIIVITENGVLVIQILDDIFHSLFKPSSLQIGNLIGICEGTAHTAHTTG